MNNCPKRCSTVKVLKTESAHAFGPFITPITSGDFRFQIWADEKIEKRKKEKNRKKRIFPQRYNDLTWNENRILVLKFFALTFYFPQLQIGNGFNFFLFFRNR